MAIRTIKPEIRILAFDDGPFGHGTKGKSVLVGVVFRGGSFMDGIVKREIEVDGSDAERTIVRTVKECRFKDIRVIMLDGITFAGFNTVNIANVHRETGLPVVAVLRREPDFDSFVRAIGKLPEPDARTRAVRDAGKVEWAEVKIGGREGRVAFQVAGMPAGQARELIGRSSTRGMVPEPLRVAHLIAGGLVRGESKGRA